MNPGEQAMHPFPTPLPFVPAAQGVHAAYPTGENYPY